VARAINRRFGRRILFTEANVPYNAGAVLLCKDAFEGLDTMEKLIDPNERGDLIGRIIAEAELESSTSGNSKLVGASRQSTKSQSPHYQIY